ncbi:MAG: ABC transporter permease [Lentisphaeria bacterium]|nr:ABC transporter permease [Lentisphaeria bacterium]
MNLLTYVRKEISFRKFNFVAGLISISLAMTVWSAAPSLLRALRKQTETLLLEREKATKREMLKLEDDYRIIMRDLGHNLMILAPDEDLVRLQREGVPLQTMPQDYASRLAVTGDIKSLNHILPVLQQKVNWPEQGGAEIILCGTPGQIPTPHRKRHLTEDGLAYLSPIVPGIPPGQLKIGSSLAEKLNLKAGQRLRLLGEEFFLAEVLPPEGSRQDVSVWCHLDWMQKALHKEGQISIILALQCICHADSLQQVSKDIKKWLPDVKIEEFSSMVKARLLARKRAAEAHQTAMRELKEHREKLFRQQKRFAGFAAPAAMLAAGLWIFFLFLNNVRERRQEMGVLRALGMSENNMLMIFLWKSVLIGILGAALGFFLGHSLALVGVEPDSALKQWYELLRWRELLLALIAAPALCILAAWLPARQAGRIDPAVMLMDA